MRIADMKIDLPNLENLRKCVDKLKQIDHDLTLCANLAGMLELVVETEGVSVTKFFKDLAPEIQRQPLANPISDEASAQFVEVSVDIREFSKILSCSVLTPLMTCDIYSSEGLVVKCVVPDSDGVGNIVEFSFHIPLKLK
jgi:Hus1-like protein